MSDRTSGTIRRTIRRAGLSLPLIAAGVVLPAGVAGAVDFGVDMYDWNQDGVVDSSALDVTGDGYLDSNLVQFNDAPGWVWLVDLNQNSEADLVGYDSNHDAIAEVWFLDADENGYAEAATHTGSMTTTTTSTIAPGTYGTSTGGGSITLRPNASGGLDVVIGMDQGFGYGGAPIETSSSVTTSQEQFPTPNSYSCANTADFDNDRIVDCLDPTVRGG